MERTGRQFRLLQRGIVDLGAGQRIFEKITLAEFYVPIDDHN